MLRKVAQLFLTRLRLSKPWRYKAPFLISVPYFMIWAGGMSPREAAIGFGMSCATIFGIAGFGYFLNDYTDQEEDQAAGKFNVMLSLPRWAIGGLLILFLALAILPWIFYFPTTPLTLSLLGLEFALFILYSAPPFRFKERGWLGVLCDAGYAHAVPGVLAGITFYELGDHSFAEHWIYLLALGLWQGMVGIRNILLHMRGDLDKDSETGTQTLGVRLGRKRLQRILVFNAIPLELTLALVFLACLIWQLGPICFVLLLFPLNHFVQYRLVNSDPFPKELEGRLSLWIDELYTLWLPLLPLLTLAMSDAYFYFLLLGHLILFRNVLGESLRNLRQWNPSQRIKYAFFVAFIALFMNGLSGEWDSDSFRPWHAAVQPLKPDMGAEYDQLKIFAKGGGTREISISELWPELPFPLRNHILYGISSGKRKPDEIGAGLRSSLEKRWGGQFEGLELRAEKWIHRPFGWEWEGEAEGKGSLDWKGGKDAP